MYRNFSPAPSLRHTLPDVYIHFFFFLERMWNVGNACYAYLIIVLLTVVFVLFFSVLN